MDLQVLVDLHKQKSRPRPFMGQMPGFLNVAKDARMELPEMKQLIPIPEGYQLRSAGRVPGCTYHSNQQKIE